MMSATLQCVTADNNRSTTSHNSAAAVNPINTNNNTAADTTTTTTTTTAAATNSINNITTNNDNEHNNIDADEAGADNVDQSLHTADIHDDQFNCLPADVTDDYDDDNGYDDVVKNNECSTTEVGTTCFP